MRRRRCQLAGQQQNIEKFEFDGICEAVACWDTPSSWKCEGAMKLIAIYAYKTRATGQFLIFAVTHGNKQRHTDFRLRTLGLSCNLDNGTWDKMCDLPDFKFIDSAIHWTWTTIRLLSLVFAFPDQPEDVLPLTLFHLYCRIRIAAPPWPSNEFSAERS